MFLRYLSNCIVTLFNQPSPQLVFIKYNNTNRKEGTPYKMLVFAFPLDKSHIHLSLAFYLN